MEFWKKLSPAVLFLFSPLIALPLPASAAENGKPFPVVGEQLGHRPPEGWKLAWMSGNANGGYIAEYIPGAEDLNSWRDGYLSIERLAYPPAEVLKELEKHKTRTADVALYQFIEQAKKSCGGQHTQMSQRTNTFNGVYFAVGGGYCDRYGPAAPFGEGSFVAFVEGKSYLFRIQYGWRPRAARAKLENGPWAISPQKATQYLEAIKATSLCGGSGQPVCPSATGPG
jgi:hypothetical protein